MSDRGSDIVANQSAFDRIAAAAAAAAAAAMRIHELRGPLARHVRAEG